MKSKVLPAALNPENLQLVSPEHRTDDVVRLISTALEEGSKAFQTIVTAEDAAAADPTMTDAARKVAVAEFAEKKLNGVAKTIDAAHAAAMKAIEAEEREIAKSSTIPSEYGDLASEVRSRLSAMSAKERRRHLSQAIEDADRVVAGAALHAPPWLSGLTPAEQNQYRLEWAMTHHADRMARIESLGKAAEVVRRGGSTFMNVVSGLTSGTETARQAAQRRQESLEA